MPHRVWYDKKFLSVLGRYSSRASYGASSVNRILTHIQSWSMPFYFAMPALWCDWLPSPWWQSDCRPLPMVGRTGGGTNRAPERQTARQMASQNDYKLTLHNPHPINPDSIKENLITKSFPAYLPQYRIYSQASRFLASNVQPSTSIRPVAATGSSPLPPTRLCLPPLSCPRSRHLHSPAPPPQHKARLSRSTRCTASWRACC